MPAKLKNKTRITSSKARTESHLKKYKIRYIILISTLIILGILAFVLIKVFTPSSFKYPALSKEVFDALDFKIEGKSYYEAVDIWDNPTSKPDFNSIKEQETKDYQVHHLDKKLRLLQQADENLARSLKGQLDIKDPYEKLANLFLIVSELNYYLDSGFEYFSKSWGVNDPRYIKKAKAYLNLFYTEHILGRYHKSRKNLFEFLQKINMRNTKNSGMILINKYKRLFELAKEFMQTLYLKTPFYFSNVEKVKDYLENLEVDEEKNFIRKFPKKLWIMDSYNYLYYLVASYEFIERKENIKVKLSDKFDRVFSPKGDTHIIGGLLMLEEALERWKLCKEEDDDYEEKEKAVFNSFKRVERIMRIL